MRPCALLFAAVFVVAAAGVTTSARAQAQTDRIVDQYLCKDIMRDSGTNRDVAIAFLHGYLLGKSGNAKFNLDALKKQTDAFIERCLNNPNEKAVEAMSTIRK